MGYFDDVNLDQGEIADMMNDPDGPVGQMLAELAADATAVAKAKAPVQSPATWSWGVRSSSYMPRSEGYLKGTVRQHMGFTKDGTLYSGVNAAFGPTLFLEKPAKQLHHSYPFMTEALLSVSL